MRSWRVEEAKARFSELLCEADDDPQVVTVCGRPAAVVLSKRAYDGLVRCKPSLVEFLRASPLAGVTLEIQRDRTSPRESNL